MSKDARNVPALRFKGYSDAWEKRKLGETNSYFTDGNYGESYPKESELSDKENGVPFLRGSNLRNGELIEDNANYITKEKHAELTSGHLVEDDIVLAVRGSLGALGYVKDENIDWNINSQLAVIRTDKSELSGKFLVQFLLSWRGQKELLSRNTGTALKQLPIKQLKDVPVPIVNLDEQKEIGALFSSIDNLIAATQDKIDALEQAKKALLQRLFDQSWRFKGYSDPWEKRKLGEIFNVVTDYVANGSFKSLRQRVSTYSNPNFAYMIRLQDASNNWKGPWLYTDQQSYSFLAKTKLNPGDILMSNVGSVGKFFLVPDLDRPMTLAPNAILLRSMTYSTYFLFQLLQTSSMTESINEKTTPGVQQKINKTDLKKIITNVPTLNESSMVGQMLSLLDNLIAATQSRLSSLELFKKSLLQDLFI